MSLNLDFGSIGPPPPDVYLFTVSEVEYKKPEGTNAKGQPKSPYLNFTHQIVEGPHEGKNVWDICSLAPQALWRLQNFLRALTGDPWEDDNMQLEPSELLGMTFKGVTDIETYDDKNGVEQKKAVITSFYPADHDFYEFDAGNTNNE
jgi:hypothetical protein